MCDVHLVPDIEELRRATESFGCGECEEPIAVGEEYRYVEGALDDGSGQRYRYRAHEDCYEMSQMEYDDSGCWQYGGVEKIEPEPKPV